MQYKKFNMQMRIKLLFSLAFFFILIILAQFQIDKIARIIPNYVGFLSFSQGEFMAYHCKFISGDIGPISIGMTEQEIDLAYQHHHIEFSKLDGVIYKDNGMIQITDPNVKDYLIKDKMLNITYEMNFIDSKLNKIILSSRLMSK